jgi:hypothetical protein
VKRLRPVKTTPNEAGVPMKKASTAEVQALGQELGNTYRRFVEEYKRFGDQPLEVMYQHAAEPASQEFLEEIKNTSCKRIRYRDLQRVTEKDPAEGLALWESINEVARDYFEAGVFAANAVKNEDPFERAQYLIYRDAFIKEWQPRGGIEQAMIDMLAQAFFYYQYWLKVSTRIIDFEHLVIEKKIEKWENWSPPRQKYVEMLDHATQLADRYNRLFLRTLRQMRDLRRYSQPVIVNNAGQVNVATNGGQQVNVQEKQKKPAKAKQQNKAGVPKVRRLKATQ